MYGFTCYNFRIECKSLSLQHHTDKIVHFYWSEIVFDTFPVTNTYFHFDYFLDYTLATTLDPK